MKYLIITGVFLVGLSLGYVAGTYTASPELDDVVADRGQQQVVLADDQADNSDGFDEENHDHDSNADSDHETDTLLNDSLLTTALIDSTLEGDHISTEKLLKSAYLPIVYLSEESSGDSAMQDALGIEEIVPSNLFVEFWESPLNFEGYKLSKKKLIVYGLSSQFENKVYRDGNDYFFSYQNVYYKMKETQDFLPLVEVSKSEVFND